VRKKLGEIKAPSKITYHVHWDQNSREVWVEKPIVFGGRLQKCPAKANSAQDAMHIASAFLHDK
jgi:hypothetical protein